MAKHNGKLLEKLAAIAVVLAKHRRAELPI